MDLQVVQEAVRFLKSQGERVSVRSVHRVTGGSFRDISRLLAELKEFLNDEESSELEAEGEAPVLPAPRLGRIAQAQQSVQAAREAMSQVAQALHTREARLRELQANPPLPALDADDTDGYLQVVAEHQAAVDHETRAVRHLKRLIASHEAERDTFLAECARLTKEAEGFRHSVIPEARHTLAELQKRRAQLRGELAVVERQVENKMRTLAAHERALARLIGDRDG
jgi:hypothetical protein